MKRLFKFLGASIGVLCILWFGSWLVAPNVKFHKYGVTIFVPTGRSHPSDYQRGHDLYGLNNPGFRVIVGIARDKNWLDNFVRPTKPEDYEFAPFVTVYRNESLGGGRARSSAIFSTQ